MNEISFAISIIISATLNTIILRPYKIHTQHLQYINSYFYINYNYLHQSAPFYFYIDRKDIKQLIGL